MIVWRGGVLEDGSRLETSTCPVLMLTPEFEELLGWFYGTHEREELDGRRPAWKRILLPHAGGFADQDNRLMAELDVVRETWNRKLRGTHGR